MVSGGVVVLRAYVYNWIDISNFGTRGKISKRIGLCEIKRDAPPANQLDGFWWHIIGARRPDSQMRMRVHEEQIHGRE